MSLISTSKKSSVKCVPPFVGVLLYACFHGVLNACFFSLFFSGERMHFFICRRGRGWGVNVIPVCLDF